MYQINRTVPAFVNDNINYPLQFRCELGIDPQQVDTGSRTLYGYNLYNPNGSTVFVKIFNSSSLPVPGTNIPVLTIAVPALGSVVFFGSDQLLYCDLGMWVITLGGYQDGDNTEVALGVLTQIQYK